MKVWEMRQTLINYCYPRSCDDCIFVDSDSCRFVDMDDNKIKESYKKLWREYHGKDN